MSDRLMPAHRIIILGAYVQRTTHVQVYSSMPRMTYQNAASKIVELQVSTIEPIMKTENPPIGKTPQ